MTHAEQARLRKLLEKLNSYRALANTLKELLAKQDALIAVYEQKTSLLRQIAIQHGAPIEEVNKATDQSTVH